MCHCFLGGVLFKWAHNWIVYMYHPLQTKKRLKRLRKPSNCQLLSNTWIFFFFIHEMTMAQAWRWHWHWKVWYDLCFADCVAYLSTHTIYQYKRLFFSIILGGYGHIGKWIQENIIFMRFCCCFKLSKKTEKLLNKQPTYVTAKCTLTGLVQ